MKKISVFGATGSVGSNACKLILENLSNYNTKVLTANKNFKKLALYSRLLSSEYAVIKDKKFYKPLKEELSGTKVKCLSGYDEIASLASIKTDIFISAIVGIAGLKATYECIGNTKILALANKESLVCSGRILMKKAKKLNTKILPLDSEHNALYQIMEKENIASIKNIILTASGGPFWNKNINLKNVSVKEALKHPNWNMGKKISIDSATMMNKVLEKVEAAILFGIDFKKINILVHPSSIVHGIVNYIDGNSQMLASKPDMKLPINYALNWPKRTELKINNINLKNIKSLNFFDINTKLFPSLKLFKYMNNTKTLDSTLIVINVANEVAVDSFLNEEIKFLDINKIIEKTIGKINHKKVKNLSDVFEINQDASTIAHNLVNKLRL